MQMTHLRLFEFMNASAQWLADDAKATVKHEKFAYAVRKVLKAAKTLETAYRERVEDLQIEHAEEKDGVLRRDAQGNLEYSKDGFQARAKAIRALNQSVVDLPAFKVKPDLVPADLTPDHRDAFEDLVLSTSADLALVERDA